LRFQQNYIVSRNYCYWRMYFWPLILYPLAVNIWLFVAFHCQRMSVLLSFSFVLESSDDMSKGSKIMSLGVINHGMSFSVLYIEFSQLRVQSNCIHIFKCVITNCGIQIAFKQLNSGSSVSPGIYWEEISFQSANQIARFSEHSSLYLMLHVNKQGRQANCKIQDIFIFALVQYEWHSERTSIFSGSYKDVRGQL
jgi:hypothetical protein